MTSILIVDDEKSIRRTLGEFLRAEGYAVVEAEDAEVAQQRLREADFDVVVSDIILPRVTGVELLRRIHDTSPDVQVVMMTGEPTAETAAQALQAGASDYLFKPVGKAAIVRAVANAARVKTLEDTRRRLEVENQAYQERLKELVTERTLQLRQSEALYQSLVEHLPQCIVRKDRDGRYTFANQRFCETMGLPLSGVIGRTDADLFAATSAARARAADRAVLDSGEGLETVEEQHMADGRQRFVQCVRSPLRDDAGLVIGVQGISWDITERKRAEDQLRKLARAVEQSSASIVITDRTGTIEFVNPRVSLVSGYTADELIGQNQRILQSGESPLEEYAQLWETITSGREWRGEFHNRRKDGTLYWESASISAIRDPAGAITHFVAIKEDVTEQKRTQEMLLRSQRVESIGGLASGIAHDLNNILAPIIMSASMLQVEDSAEDRQDLVRIIESSAQRAVGVVKQLLSFARGQEGARHPVQVRPLVRDMAAIARETFPRSIGVEDSTDPNLWTVIANATQVHQVLLNLCVNARDAMPNGGTLTLRAENVTLDQQFLVSYPEVAAGPFVRLQVSDTGTGIPEAAQAHIFEAFFTTKGEGRGTGLGLATVKGIVEEHRGIISFSTAPGRGTTFEVCLPAAPGASTDAPPAAIEDAAQRGQGELILLVDDEPAVRKITSRTLEQHGYRVVQAQDGIEALSKYAAHQSEIRAVVTDFLMPKMDGVTLCRALRALAPQLPLIVSSGGLFGEAGDQASRAFAALGVYHVLRKPHNAELLLQAVAEAVAAPAREGPPGE